MLVELTAFPVACHNTVHLQLVQTPAGAPATPPEGGTHTSVPPSGGPTANVPLALGADGELAAV